MNLHGLVTPFISAVNPATLVTIQRSTGYTTAADGSRTSTYETLRSVPAQIQSLTADELRQVDGLNLQGVKRAAYLNGDWRGVVRADAAGGDLMIFNGQTWRVVLALETWPDWSKVALCLQ